MTIILGMMLSFSVFASPNLDDAPTDDKPIIPAPEDAPKQYLPIMIQCDAADKSLDVMEKFNEEPFITGIFIQMFLSDYIFFPMFTIMKHNI